MDKSVFFSTFATLFLAEFGDKTQLAAINLAASTRKPWPVFLGAASALAAVTAIGVLFGEGLVKLVPPLVLRRSAAALFVVMGVWMWVHVD
jgi:putative Ca2+/H+ antiporter (TMEM165/GDT1 family)